MKSLNYPHRRYNPLTREWMIVSPQRAKRPWLGQLERIPQNNLPKYDPKCHLCPGNVRSEGDRNPNYVSTYVFDDDFPALLPPESDTSHDVNSTNLFQVEPEYGLCRVVCYSPRHDLTFPELTAFEGEAVVREWINQNREIAAFDFINYIQVFENKGAVMGCSMPHPHSQVWGTGHIPVDPQKETAAQQEYFTQNGTCLLCDYLAQEKSRDERIVAGNAGFTALVPFWAVWPFEVLVVSNRHLASFDELNEQESSQLADIFKQVTIRYDNLFEIPFPYTMGFHQAPCNSGAYPGWHFHAHFYPPLLRSATIRKFFVGFEMLGTPQRDITPEAAAEKLRAMPAQHYRHIVK